MNIDILKLVPLIILIGLVLSFLFKSLRILNIEKRFSPFSLSSTNIKENSLLDDFINIIWKLIGNFSKIIKHSVFFTNYGKRYDKYILFEDLEIHNGIDYVSVKFLISITFSYIYLLASLFHYITFELVILLLIFLIAFFVPDLFLSLKFRIKRKKVEEDLLKAIILMNNSFKSGKNIMQAIATVKKELTGPIADEFKKIYLDITYGLSLEIVFSRFYERVKLEDAKYVASSLTLLNKTGGNIIKVFEMIEKSFFDRKKLRQEMRSLTSASVFVFRVLVILPFVFTLIIYILNPAYFNPLFDTKIGIFFLSLIISLFILYVMVIKKVLKVKI